MIIRNYLFWVILSLAFWLVLPAFAQVPPANPNNEGRNVSPNQKRVDKEKLKNMTPLPPLPNFGKGAFPEEYRTIDGTGNNLRNPNWGSAPIPLLRLTKVGYEDGVGGVPSGQSRPNVRDVSNLVADQGDQDRSYTYGRRYSDFVWQWGQFLDHDLDLTPVAHPIEPMDIEIPTGDTHFDPDGKGGVTMPLERSVYKMVNGVREQMNHITAYIDASNVYGSDPIRAEALKANDGNGRMKTSTGNLLPFNVDRLPNAAPGGTDPTTFFIAGDFRANEQVGLTAMHTLFVREHNHWADYFRKKYPHLDGDDIYQYARAMVAAEMQCITYNEFLLSYLERGP